MSSRGGVNAETLSRLSALEDELREVKSSKATETGYGLAKISDAQDVTNPNSGMVLSSVQNNASVEGTLAHKIEQIENRIGQTVSGSVVVNPAGHIVKIQAEDVKNGTVFAQNGDATVSGTLVTGVSVHEHEIYVHLSENVNSLIRINYIYKKKGK